MRPIHLAAVAGSVCALIFACSSTTTMDVSGDDGGSGDGATDSAPPPCSGPADCPGGACQDGACRPASCTDGTKDGTETDVDCGGSCARCADLMGCATAKDCTSGVCTAGICQVPTHGDGVKNGDETGVDCGGPTAPNKCPTGQGCNATSDCDHVKCDAVNHVCVSASHSDGIVNDGETDVDCGGTTGAMRCEVGQRCVGDGDCNAVKCDVGGTMKCLPPSHTDGIKNDGETGIDCGGTAPTKCPSGQGCMVTADCDNVKCDVGATNLCLPASHTDGIKNDGETGIDCGGTAPTKCPPGQGCLMDADCNNTRCNAMTMVCDPPTATDHLRNGTETDVDCGGGAPTNAPRCPDDKSCLADADCSSTFCNAGSGKCVAGLSCKTAATGGVVTCGKREIDDPTHVWESCCRSLPLPSTPTVRLDKYEVTAGRFRQFIAAVGPDIRTWAANQIAANNAVGQRIANDIPPAWRALLPASANGGDPLNLHVQIGMTVMDSRVPSTQQGCYNGTGAYGANTYYWDQATLQGYFGGGFPARRYTQEQYDEKPMNCAPYWLYATFCAWDGGRLPTQSEMNDAWGTGTYPYDAGTNDYPFPLSPTGPYAWEQTANYYNNRTSGQFYNYPGAPDGLDEAGDIGAPGRFLRDATMKTSPANGESWMDLGANVMEMVHVGAPGTGTFCDWSVFAAGDTPSASCVDSTNHPGVNGVLRSSTMAGVPWVGGSWEGHRAFSTTNQPFFTNASYSIPSQAQYGKTGFRCAR